MLKIMLTFFYLRDFLIFLEKKKKNCCDVLTFEKLLNARFNSSFLDCLNLVKCDQSTQAMSGCDMALYVEVI